MCEDDIKLIEEYVKLMKQDDDYQPERVYDKNGAFKGIKLGRYVFNPIEKADHWYGIVTSPNTDMSVTEHEVSVCMWEMTEDCQHFEVNVSEVVEHIDGSGATTMDYLVKRLPLMATIKIMKKMASYYKSFDI